MNKEEFVKEQMKLSKEDIIANYWYTYQDNVERLGIEHQLKLKDKEIERLNEEIKGYKQERERVLNIIEERNSKAIEYIIKRENQFFIPYFTSKEANELIDILKGE